MGEPALIADAEEGAKPAVEAAGTVTPLRPEAGARPGPISYRWFGVPVIAAIVAIVGIEWSTSATRAELRALTTENRALATDVKEARDDLQAAQSEADRAQTRLKTAADKLEAAREDASAASIAKLTRDQRAAEQRTARLRAQVSSWQAKKSQARDRIWWR